MVAFLALLAGYAMLIAGLAWISPALALAAAGALLMVGAWWWERGSP